MKFSICSKALSDSELSNIYLRYDEENKTKRKLQEIANSNPEDPFALVEWLAYIAFGEDYIGMEKSYRIIDECVGRIEQAIHFWKEDKYEDYTSYKASLLRENDYVKESLVKMKYEKFWRKNIIEENSLYSRYTSPKLGNFYPTRFVYE